MVEQCCALSNNKRCENYVIEHTNHCQMHYGPSIKLYKKYKKICDVAYKLDLNKKFKTIYENINYLMDCYRWFNLAFNARMEHRKYAFVPECYDDGHDYQFVFIKNKILECEKLLCELNIANERQKVINNNYYDLLENQESRELVIYEPKHNENVDCLVDISTIIMKNNNERKKVEEDVEEMMERYRKENEEILQKRNLLQNLIIKYLDKFLDKHGQNRYIMYVAVYSIIKEMNKLGYFAEKYKPVKCCHDCGHYIGIPFILSCRCLYNYSCFKSFLNKPDNNSLKVLYELLLREEKKYEPIFLDFLKLYYIFEDETLFMDLEVIWDDKLNRLKMQQRSSEKEEKHSKVLARMRLKKKILERDGYIDDLSD
jgi:hypothetical protein